MRNGEFNSSLIYSVLAPRIRTRRRLDLRLSFTYSLDHMSKTAEAILQNLKISLHQLYGNRLKGLYLYGSFARGEERVGSDLDVAMILEDFDRPWTEIQRTSRLVSDLSLEYGVTVSLIPLRILDWSMNQKPLVRAIQREGVMV